MIAVKKRAPYMVYKCMFLDRAVLEDRMGDEWTHCKTLAVAVEDAIYEGMKVVKMGHSRVSRWTGFVVPVKG